MLRSIPSSMKRLVDNPIETTGQFSGVVIDARKEEVLILAPTEAIETADRRIRANVNFDLTMELLAMTIKENIDDKSNWSQIPSGGKGVLL